MLPTRICVAIIWPKLGVQGVVVGADYISSRNRVQKKAN